jgi:arylsulfate sulfotransferase
MLSEDVASGVSMYRLPLHLLTALVLLTLSCVEEPSAPQGETQPDTSMSLDIPPDAFLETAPVDLDLSVTVEPDPRSPLVALVRTSTSVETRVRVRATRGSESPRFTRWSAPGIKHTVEVLGLGAQSSWELHIQAEATSGEGSVEHTTLFQTQSLPEGMPTMAITAYDPDRAAPGLTFFGVSQLEKPNSSELPLFVAVDPLGEIVWMYQDADTDHNKAARSVTVIDDDTLLLFVGDGFRTISLGGDIGLRVSGDAAIGGTLHHDAIPLANGGFLALGRDSREIELESTGEPAIILGDRVIELDAQGALVWEWSTFDHMDPQHFPTNLSRKPNPKNGSYDWTHGNALIALEGGDFLLSMRHQHQLARVDRETGEVVWLLGEGGDFSLEAGQWFYGQHGPVLREDGALLIYDNGNDRPGEGPSFSRAVGYELDSETMTATEVVSWTVPEYTSFLGGVQGLATGSMLVCAGGVRLPGSESASGIARIIEVAEDGDEVWRLEVQGNIYRALRVEGLLWNDE